jgi:hypothetical protein
VLKEKQNKTKISKMNQNKRSLEGKQSASHLYKKGPHWVLRPEKGLWVGYLRSLGRIFPSVTGNVQCYMYMLFTYKSSNTYIPKFSCYNGNFSENQQDGFSPQSHDKKNCFPLKMSHRILILSILLVCYYL